jgi:antitoxin HicB
MTQQNYRIILEPTQHGYIAYVPDLPGCMGEGDTPQAALDDVLGAIEEWIDLARKLGRSVPEPSKEQHLG